MKLYKLTQHAPHFEVKWVATHHERDEYVEQHLDADVQVSAINVPTTPKALADFLNEALQERGQDPNLIPTEALEIPHNFKQPFLLCWNNHITEFPNEDHAAEFQRNHRIRNRRDPETGVEL